MPNRRRRRRARRARLDARTVIISAVILILSIAFAGPAWGILLAAFTAFLIFFYRKVKDNQTRVMRVVLIVLEALSWVLCFLLAVGMNMASKSDTSQNKVEESLPPPAYLEPTATPVQETPLPELTPEPTPIPATHIYDGAEIKDIMNGPKTEKLGEFSLIRVPSSAVTMEALNDWYYNYVEPNDFNWCMILYTDRSDAFGVYATSGFVQKDVPFEVYGTDDYGVGTPTDATVTYYPGDDGTLNEFVPAPEVETASSLTALKQGDKGDDVKIMQALLITFGYLKSGESDGIYGPGTTEAVKAFQQRNGLTADGVAGPDTLSRLYSDDVVSAADTKEAGQGPTLEHGELLSVITNVVDGKNVAVVKAKITPSFSNSATVHQNYYNVVDLIENQGFNSYDEIQYWAVADMTDGSEGKVISFTMSKSLIDTVFSIDNFPANTLGSYVDDLWVLPSLAN